MNDIDYSTIKPNQVSAAKRIIAAIESYDALHHRSNEDVAKIAASIGLSIWRFRRLVRVWHAYKDLRLLVLNNGKEKGGRRLTPEALLIIDDEVRNPQNGQDTNRIVSRVQARCLTEGLQIPVKPTILRKIRAHQASNPEAFNPSPRIVIGRMWIRLPTMHDDYGSITPNPCLLAAVALPEARLLAYQVTFDHGQPASIEDLLRTLVAQNDNTGKPRPIYIHPTDFFLAKAVIQELGIEKSGVFKNEKSFKENLSYLGSLGRYPVLYRPAPKSQRNSEVLKMKGSYLPHQDTLREIEQAVMLHNADHTLKVPIRIGR